MKLKGLKVCQRDITNKDMRQYTFVSVMFGKINKYIKKKKKL